MRQGRSVAPKCSVVRRATVLFISLAGAAWGCASFGTAASDVPLDSGVEAAASKQPEASVDAGQPEAGGRCGFAVDDGFDSDNIDSAWSVTQHGRSRIVTSEVFKKAGAKSLQLSVASTANEADTQAGYLRRGLGGASCLALDFWLKVQDDATGDLFVALVSGPRVVEGGGSTDKNLDVRILLGPGRKLIFGEQSSGGKDYSEYASVALEDSAFHHISLFVDASGLRLNVEVKVDEKRLNIPTDKQLLIPTGELQSLTLGPSFAQASARATLYYDSVELR